MDKPRIHYPQKKIVRTGDKVSGLKNDAGYVDDAGASSAAPIQSIVAGTNISVDNTDPNNPVVNAMGASAMLPAGYIDGLQMKWVSGTALTLSSGAAYIEGSADVLHVASDIAKTGLSLSASTWYHAYLYDNEGTPDFILSTTDPDAPYSGIARSMTGDTGKRYVISIRVGGSGSIIAFMHIGSRVIYLTDVGARTLLSNGTETANTVVSASNLCPLTAKTALLFAQNTWSDNAYLGNSDVGTLGLSANRISYLLANTIYPTNVPLASDQSFSYLMKPGTGSGLTVYLSSYEFER